MAYLSSGFDPKPTPRFALMAGTISELTGKQLVVSEGERVHIPYMTLRMIDVPEGADVDVIVNFDSPPGPPIPIFERYPHKASSQYTDEYRIPGPFDLDDRGSIEFSFFGASGNVVLIIPHISFAFRNDFEWSDAALRDGKLDVKGIQELLDGSYSPPVEGILNAGEITDNPWDDFIDVSGEIPVEGKSGLSVYFNWDKGDATNLLEVRFILLNRDSSIQVVEPYYDDDYETQLDRTRKRDNTSGDKMFDLATDGRHPKVKVQARCVAATTAKINAGGVYYLGG